MSSVDQEPSAEARLNIQDVPGEISRIFFGSHEGGGRPPSYWDGGYSGGGGLGDPGRPMRLVYPGAVWSLKSIEKIKLFLFKAMRMTFTW